MQTSLLLLSLLHRLALLSLTRCFIIFSLRYINYLFVFEKSISEDSQSAKQQEYFQFSIFNSQFSIFKAGSGSAKVLLLFGRAILFRRKGIKTVKEIIILPQCATSSFLFPHEEAVWRSLKFRTAV